MILTKTKELNDSTAGLIKILLLANILFMIQIENLKYKYP